MSTSQQHASSSSHSSSNSNIIGVHFRVGRKIGEGSFGVIFEGQPLPASPFLSRSQSKRPSSLDTAPVDAPRQSRASLLGPGHSSSFLRSDADILCSTGHNLLNSQTVAIKFVRLLLPLRALCSDAGGEYEACRRRMQGLMLDLLRTRRNRARATHLSFATSTVPTRSSPVRVRALRKVCAL